MAGPVLDDPRVHQAVGDIADPSFVASVVDGRTSALFHLAAVVSGTAEADFELGLRINLDATRLLLDRARSLATRPRLVFTSSVAVYGGSLPHPVPASMELNPHTSYGTQKAMAELLINDYSRRGFVDGRSLRLPTISVRPGAANAAASSFASGIIREPLNGQTAICPVGADARMWLLSPRTAVACLLHAHALPPEAYGGHRAISLPGISATVGEMVAALEEIAGPEVAARIRWERDPRIERMVAGWPGAIDTSRALALGFPADRSFSDLIREYIAETAELAGRIERPS